MRPAIIVVLSPVGDHHLGLAEGLKQLAREQLVAHARPEGLDVGILPGRAGLDVAGPGLREAAEVAQGVGGEPGAVVAADVLGRCASLGHQAVEHCDGRDAGGRGPTTKLAVTKPGTTEARPRR